MKLPTINQVTDILKECRPKLCDWHGDDLKDYVLESLAKQIISFIKELQFDEQAETPEVDPNLVKIAELEAKLKVYETVINAAGLAIAVPPKKRGEISFAIPKKEEK